MAEAAAKPPSPPSQAGLIASEAAERDNAVSPEYIRVIVERTTIGDDETVRYYTVQKRTLINESGYFKALLEDPDKSDNDGEVELLNENREARKWVLGCLVFLPDQPVWYVLDHHTQTLKKLRNHWMSWKESFDDDWSEMELLREVYLIADKYSIHSIKSTLARWVIPEILEMYLDYRHGQCASATDILNHFFNPVHERLGNFPEDLFPAYTQTVMHFIDTQEDVSLLLDAAAAFPELSAHLNRELAEKMKDTRQEKWKVEQANKTMRFELDVCRGWRPKMPKGKQFREVRRQSNMKYRAIANAEGDGYYTDEDDY